MTLRNDATRLRIVGRDRRRFRAVVARQGQVLMDTDLDQQARHQLERVELGTKDELGAPGRMVVPAGDTGFLLTASANLTDSTIGAGHGYLGGWLLENPNTCTLATQPHPRSDTVTGPAVIALKSLVRYIDSVEEQALADAALGDAHASGRSLLDWQVFPLPLAAGTTVSCATVGALPEWQSLIQPSTGTLAVMLQTTTPSTNPCSLTPGAGYTRLENLLYRIEVHGGVPVAGAPSVDGPRYGLQDLVLKFSRRNASVMVRITDIAASTFTVTPPALDARNWFSPGAYAEIVSRHDDVDPRAAAASERLFRVARTEDAAVVLEASAAQLATLTALGLSNDGSWFLRLWDAFPGGAGVAVVSAPGGAATSLFVELGDGVRLQLGGATAFFRRGDYWTCAARADGTIDWPSTGAVSEQLAPHGPETRYAALASLPTTTFEDCRIPFATLTDRSLFYRGGDGQCVFAPGDGSPVALPAKLRVAVMRGQTPVVGATVRWSLAPGATPCTLNGQPCTAVLAQDFVSDANGLVEVVWSLDSKLPMALQRVQAAIATGAGSTLTPALEFNATFALASQTTYTPGKCEHLKTVNNVQDAIDALCAVEHETACGELVIGPDNNAEQVLTALAPDGDARICVHPGTFALRRTIVVRGTGHLLISGAGRASHFVGDQIECLVRFVDWQSVTLRDLSFEIGRAGEREQGLRGVIAFEDCGRVDLEHVRVRSGAALVSRQLSGIQARTIRDDRADSRVRISHCEIEVGHAQTGILVVDSAHTEIESNRVTSRAQDFDVRASIDEPRGAATLGRLLLDRVRLVPDSLFNSDLFLGDDVVPLSADTLDNAGLESRPGRVTLAASSSGWPTRDGRVLVFDVHPSFATADVWSRLFSTNPIAGRDARDRAGQLVTHPDSWFERGLRHLRTELVRAFFELPSPVVVSVELRAALERALRPVIDGSNQTAGGQGIVVGGRRTPPVGAMVTTANWNTLYVGDPRTPSVRVLGNHVEGFVQGVHIGMSNNARNDTEARRLRTYRARVADNTILLRVPAISGERHGIFVGNAQSVQVVDNMVELTYPLIENWAALLPLDGIRLWGSYGPMLQVRGNHCVGVTTGVRVHVLNPHIAQHPTISWLVQDNAYAGFGDARDLLMS